MLSRVRRWLKPHVPELAPGDAYRLWAENYPPYAHNLLMEVEERAMCDLLPDVRDRRVLDLASGTGRYTHLLMERGAHVVALDFSYEMLAHIEKGLVRVQGDMRALPLRDAFAEVIVCGLAVGHLADLSVALKEIGRVLVAGGTLLYSDFHAAGEKLGWQRTFRSANKTYAVEHHPRSEQEQTRALRDSGFIVETTLPVHISAELAQVDARAAKFRATCGDVPVALVVRALKS